MPANSQHGFSNTELDPHLVSAPFKVQTNWHVITGASCSGKTTLIDQLAEKGFMTVPEVTREYIEQRKPKDGRSKEIRADQAALTSQVYGMMIEREHRLQTSETAFLDRGLPDAFAFFRYAGINPNEILLDCFQYRYASVFMLDRLPYQRDEVRAADDMTAVFVQFMDVTRLQGITDTKLSGYQCCRLKRDLRLFLICFPSKDGNDNRIE